ncbi:hypothetical protein TNCV_2528891 [Trichonephila clavipes]|nr:hypothetical protein TNCV_2528891 [Trichonephila clavipes]
MLAIPGRHSMNDLYVFRNTREFDVTSHGHLPGSTCISQEFCARFQSPASLSASTSERDTIFIPVTHLTCSAWQKDFTPRFV